MKKIEVNDNVWWEDPDHGHISFAGTVTSIEGDIYWVADVDDEGCHTGGGASARLQHLSLLDEDWNCVACGQDCYKGEGCADFPVNKP
jgi:hypothetical protein